MVIEKGKISAPQIGKMIYLAVTPTAILSTPAITYQFAKQDLWISPMWAFSGVIAIWIALSIHRLFPGENLVQAGERILGRRLGKVFGLVILLYYLYLGGVIVREYGEFVVGAFLVQTPLLVVTGSMVLVCAIVVRSGVEIIARFADVFIPVFALLFLLLIIPLLPDLHILKMLPIMGEGIGPSLSGSVVLQAWFSEFLTVSFLIPFANRAEKVKKSMAITLLAVIVTLVSSNLVTLLLLGDLTGNYIYPFLIVARYINLADFFTHLESLFMAIWVLGAFVKICVFFYVTAMGAAQWMNLREYQPIVFPVGFLLLLMSVWVAPNLQELTHALSTSIIFSALTVLVCIPAALFGVAWIRRQWEKKNMQD
ncbi:GerAB/ArcD/ProY family transporter [Effusibacillus consociatus]|uniref:Endospore germination permease n=1 Tax=Effusibacillus consociatus TaxID=1117041 RepID=A0ABV9Q8D8_9BACL